MAEMWRGMKRLKYLVGVEAPRAWQDRGLVRHAGHIEAILQQRQLKGHAHHNKTRKRTNTHRGGWGLREGCRETHRKGKEEKKGKEKKGVREEGGRRRRMNIRVEMESKDSSIIKSANPQKEKRNIQNSDKNVSKQHTTLIT